MNESRKNKLSEFFTETNGKLSHTKLWSNIASATIVIFFMNEIYNNAVTIELLIVYGGLFISQRIGSGVREKMNSET